MRFLTIKTERVRLFGYFLISFVLIALLVLSFELFIIFKKRINNGIHENEFYASQVLAFDDKYSVAELKEMGPLVGDHLKYRPWVQFGNYDHSNKYSVVHNGIRKTATDQACSGMRVTAWFFGGSTMYGVGVPWWDSIPSHFTQHAKTRGVCVTAINYGVPYFFSAQEAMYFFIELIRTKERPNLVIFLDGLNDFAEPGSSIKVEPFFTPVLDETIPYGTRIQINSVGAGLFEHFATYQFVRKLFRIEEIDSASRNWKIPDRADGSEQDPTDDAAKEIVNNYISTRALLKSICTDQKIKCVQFLQPIAIKDYRPPDSDILTESFRKSDGRLFLAGYKYLAENLAEKNGLIPLDHEIWFYDISDTLSEYQGIAYIDSIHYSPRATDVISKRMVDIIFR